MAIVTIGDEQFEVCEEVAQEIESLRKGMENIAHCRALAEMALKNCTCENQKGCGKY